jgi:hypothetical protein
MNKVLILMLAVGAPGLVGAEAGRGELYSVIDLSFTGPSLGPSSTPARDVDFWIRFRHESGAPEIKVHGFWDGDGAGNASGNVFKVRFCPTKAGRWDLIEVHSNRAELLNEKEGDYVTATASSRKGFWMKDPASPGQRWYKRSDNSHAYIFGNTHYSFLSERRDTGATGSTIAADVNANAGYFNKLRFSIHGDRYPHPTERPFLDNAGAGSEDGDFSHRPNPVWWHRRVDLAVRTAFEKDLIADLILAGPDVENARATLRASGNGGDNTPYLKYIAARYGSYPNVWLCFCNEYDIKVPVYTNAQVIAAGQALKNFLPYSTPVSIHAAPNDWDGGLNSSPAWHDHYILQSKIKNLAAAADNMSANHPRAGGDAPGINDELGYQGAGDGFSEGDILEGHLGAFLGGGYGSTGEKYGNKLGQYFWGDFDPAIHSAADNLLWIRQRIDARIAFWNLAPAAPGSSIFGNTDPGFRALQGAGNEYVLGTDTARAGITAALPAGTWQVTRFDAVAKTETTLSTTATGTFTFDSPGSRAVFFHFKKTSGGGSGSMLDVPCEADTYVYQSFPTTNYGTGPELAVGGGTTRREMFLRFNVAGLPAGATVTDARLLLVCNGSSAATGGTIRKFGATNAQWSETQPTWNSPLAGTDGSGDLSTLGPVDIGGTYAFPNLKSAVTGNGRVTFVVRSAAQDGAQYRSREHPTASERPVLRITYTASTSFTVTIDSVSTGKPYSLGTAQAGALYYIDRSYTLTSLSAALNGGRMIRAANDDKTVTASSHLTFTVSAPATVYVGFDTRAATVPSWLGSWRIVPETLAVTDSGASPMRVYSRSVPAGSLTLGGNMASSGSGGIAHYVVIVKPSTATSAKAEELEEGTWVHENDADGDGLDDGFEAVQGTDPAKADTDGDGLPDESELSAGGIALWDLQASVGPSPDGGSGGGGCGLMGVEILALAWLRRRRGSRIL